MNNSPSGDRGKRGRSVGPEFSWFKSFSDFMTEIRTGEQRKALIRKFGHTPESVEEFEKSRGLPNGAFEVIIMLEDEELQKILRRLSDRIASDPDLVNNPDEKLRAESEVVIALVSKYPSAMRFINELQSEVEKSGLLTRYNSRLGPIPKELFLPLNAVAFVNGGVLVNLVLATNVVFVVKAATEVVLEQHLAIHQSTAVYTSE